MDPDLDLDLDTICDKGELIQRIPNSYTTHHNKLKHFLAYHPAD